MSETVDPNWAKGVLTWWIEDGITALKINPGARHPESATCRRGPQTDALFEREIQTRRVIGVVLGIYNVDVLIHPSNNRSFVELRTGIDLAQRALGHLADAAETEKYIQGTSAPTMSTDSLHPLVWDAAAKLWRDEHYSMAVQRAATFLNAHVQDLTGRRDVSDSALMAQAFSPNPPGGRETTASLAGPGFRSDSESDAFWPSTVRPRMLCGDTESGDARHVRHRPSRGTGTARDTQYLGALDRPVRSFAGGDTVDRVLVEFRSNV